MQNEDRYEKSREYWVSTLFTIGLYSLTTFNLLYRLILFSKFLELLIYHLPSPTIYSCPGPAKIQYDFQGKGKEVHFWCQELSGVYEVWVQVLQSDASHGRSYFSSKEKAEGKDNLEKVKLQWEISAWWEDIGKRLNLLKVNEARCSDDDYQHGCTRLKALPWVPSKWVDYDDDTSEETVAVNRLPAATSAKYDRISGFYPPTTQTQKPMPDLQKSFHRKRTGSVCGARAYSSGEAEWYLVNILEGSHRGTWTWGAWRVGESASNSG